MRELIDKIKNDDVSAVEELYQQVYATGMKVAVSYVGKEGLEEDMFHDAFIKAVQNLDKFDATRPFQAWFDVIVANTCKSYLRKKKPELMQQSEEETDEFLNEISDMGNPETCWDQKEVRQIIKNMLDELSKEQKEAVILHYYQNMSVAWIAEYQACSVETVKSRLFQARNKLKAAVETYEKKTNTKLHTIGITIAMFLFFKSSMGNAYACEMDIKIQKGKGDFKVNDGIKAEGMKLSTKVAIGIVAAGVVAGIAAFGIATTENKVASSGSNQTSEEVIAENESGEMNEASSGAESYEVAYKVSKSTTAFVDEAFFADCLTGVQECGMNQITPGWACTEFYDKNQQALADGTMNGLQYFEVNGIADISQVTEYTYDEAGNLVGEVVSGRDPFAFAYSGNLATNTINREMEYDEAGNVIRKAEDINGEKTTYEYSYDQNGNLIKINEDNGIHELIYDEKGNLLKEAYLNSWSNEYEYDESGNVIKEINVDRSWGDPWTTETNYEYTFDDVGNVVLRTCRSTDLYGDNVSSVGYVYNEVGKVVQEISYNSQGNKNDSTEYVYDEAGNMVQEIFYDSEGNIGVLTEYVYDENGNKIKTDILAGYSLTSVEHTINGLFVESKLQGEGGFPEDANPSGDWRTTVYLGGCVPVYYSYSDNNVVQSEVGKNISFYGALSCVCVYDEAGNVIKEIWCNTEGTPVVETTYEYAEVKVLAQ